MKTFRIENTVSGLVMGEYEGETAEAAIKAMLVDAGAADQEPSADLIAIEV